MVINKEMKRKRKEESTSGFLDESPKRTKVHAQRKFAQGSNVSSPAITPVITPIKELEKQEKLKPDGLPEQQELLPMHRPPTEDFLTFLCFRGTSMLPSSLNFFNHGPVVSSNRQPPSMKVEVQKPYIPINNDKPNGNTEKPFIAFGVRKRADPILISKQMDKKRRHALALQALRRKYQEQKMAKIRAVTISKLSEKVTSKTIVRTRSVAKTETSKKSEEKVKIIASKKVNLARNPIKSHIPKKMCLRSFPGRFTHHELQIKAKTKKPITFKKKTEDEEDKEESLSEFSSDDDEPLVNSLKTEGKPANKSKKPEIRVTRASVPFSATRNQRKIPTLRTKSHFVKLTKTSNPSFKVLRKNLRTNSTSKEKPIKKIEKVNTRASLAKIPDQKTVPKKVKTPETKKQETKAEESEAKKVVKVTKEKKKVASPTEEIKKTKTCEKPRTEPIKRRTSIRNEEFKVSQRPTRKTKEAAAIYMEILGHKLVNESDLDDDLSIDSFPELPNVRKTEQRENELKAKAKSKSLQERGKRDVNKPAEGKSKDEETVVKQTKECAPAKVPEIIKAPPKPTKVEIVEKSEENKDLIEKQHNYSSKLPSVPLNRLSYDELPLKHLINLKENIKTPENLKASPRTLKICSLALQSDDLKKQTPTKGSKIESDSEESTTSEVVKPRPQKPKETNASSTDSDEEPLSRLLPKNSKTETKTKTTDDEEKTHIAITKPKRECTKRPQNYRSLFSSSDDDERFFHGFKFDESPPRIKPKREKSPVITQSADLLCKDVDKRFGKGKVNMSNEQIEKWLTDSANSIKKDEVEKLDLCITPDLAFTIPGSLSPPKSLKSIKEPSKPIERKTIFRKEKADMKPNVNAFSPNNESSVYAFEAENDDGIKTPFRRPSRRPSSTTTSKSEESFKHEQAKKQNAFYVPQVKPESKSPPKQEVAIMLTTEESTSGSIAVQLNLDSSESAVQSSGEQVFYIPLQPGKQTSQLIQGVAVKLGTKGTSGSNRVVMSAKLVTHTPMTVPHAMEPPPVRLKATKSSLSKSSDRASESSDERHKVPHSPSASSSSSAKMKRPGVKTRVRSLEFCTPLAVKEFPSLGSPACLLEAPIFTPTDKEFQDPLDYIEKIRPQAEKFGICRIIPPANFKPECKVADDMRFTAYNQYIHKMLHRWGPNFKELMAISKYLKTQNIILTHPPWIGGMEIDLPKLYQTVQSLGGLKEVIEKKKWAKVSELMKIPKSAQDRVTKLDDIYCKYLLPYDTLSPAEREKLFHEVETDWAKRESKSLLKSQQNITTQEENSNSESDSDDEFEECIVKGRSMALNAFYRIGRNTMSMWFKTMEPSAQDVEQEFWKNVIHRQNHICVHSGSIDSGSWGYGFAVSKNSPCARHAWNLKVLTNNSSSILRSMGPKMGVTVPTLHVGMVFSACCWYRDPHSLPWIEYLHTGRNKIWYSIPNSNSEAFHSALLKLVPNYCRNKSLWLPSDTVMIPPNLLVEHGVSLCRTVQEPGQFIVVFPKAFTSSICTGYVVSESVYFAPPRWLHSALNAFNELRNSCEPSMFSLEKLILNVATDARSNVDVLRDIVPIVDILCNRDKVLRAKLKHMGVNKTEKLQLPETSVKSKKKQQNESGDYECDVCCKNLFISWVTEAQDEIYCLEDAIDFIEKKKCEPSNCKLTYCYDQEELEDLKEKIKTTIINKMQKKSGKTIHDNCKCTPQTERYNHAPYAESQKV